MKHPFVPLSEPLLAGNEERYVSECLSSGWISTSSPFVSRFETQLAHAVGVPHAVATQSGTAALHAALAALEIGPQDAVAVSSLSFIAPANAIRYVGALPIFVDAEPEHGQMCPDRLEALLENECEPGPEGPLHRASGRRLRAVIPVHVLGHPAEMPRILAIARRFGLFVIEDAAEALGAFVRGFDARGRPDPQARTAAGTFGDIGCFSFNGNKTVTAGGGGALVCREPRFAARARHLTLQAKADAQAYVHDEVGFNYRMTGLHAAVGCAQLEQLARHVERKRAIRQAYDESLRDVPGLRLIEEAPWAESSAWLTAIRVEAGYGSTAAELVQGLEAAGIGARCMWQPLHRSPAHAPAHREGGAVAEALHRELVCLPSSAGLADGDLRRVVDWLRTGASRRILRVASA